MPSPTLVMIHGIVGSLEYFDPQGRVRGAEVRGPHLLGYGDFRDAPRERLTLASQAEHVIAQVERLGVRGVWLVGHSMGGAVVMLVADRRPGLVQGVINVEGNFTLKDAFWSKNIVRKTPAEWGVQYQKMQEDVPGWLTRCGVEPTPQRIEWAAAILAHQPAETVYAMAQAIMTEAVGSEYDALIRRVVDSGIPIHLIAGAKSAEDWGVPDLVRRVARSYVEMPDVGHLMMLEAPDEFCSLIDLVLES